MNTAICRAGPLTPPFSPTPGFLTFEPGSGLEEGLLECHVEVKIEPFVFSNVVSYSGKQDKVVEALSHAFFQVRGKNPSRVGVSKSQDSLVPGPLNITVDGARKRFYSKIWGHHFRELYMGAVCRPHPGQLKEKRSAI